MKPIVTWIVLANTREAKVVVHHGIGKGLRPESSAAWQAAPAIENADRAGTGHSIGGPGVSAVDQGDPQAHANGIFAKEIAKNLAATRSKGKFDRLVICAAPLMLGLLRKELSDPVRKAIISEIDKDFSDLSIDQLESQLAKVMAV